MVGTLYFQHLNQLFKVMSFTINNWPLNRDGISVGVQGFDFYVCLIAKILRPKYSTCCLVSFGCADNVSVDQTDPQLGIFQRGIL